MKAGYYYLHSESRDLIFKAQAPEPSDFVRRIWKIDFSDRMDGWLMLIEALSMGADRDRVDNLATLWGMDAQDLARFLLRYIEVNGEPSYLMKQQVRKFTKEILGLDFDRYLAWLMTQDGSQLDELDWDTLPGFLASNDRVKRVPLGDSEEATDESPR